MIKYRQIQLLRWLHKEDRFCTAKEIAQALGCSSKTVYNDVTFLREYLIDREWGSLASRPNCGIRLQLTQKGALALEQTAAVPPEVPEPLIGQTDELGQLMKYLLRRRSATMEELGRRMYASRSLVERSLARAAPWLEEMHLRLVKTRGIGLRIVGRELYFRFAEWYLFCGLYRELSTRHPVRYAGVEEVIRLYFDGFDTAGVVRALQSAEKALGITLAYDTYTRLQFFGSLVVWYERHSPYEGDRLEIALPSDLEKKLGGILKRELQEQYQCQIGGAGQDFLHLGVALAEVARFEREETRLHFLQQYKKLGGFLAQSIELMGCVLQADFSGDALLEMQLFWALRSMTVLGTLRVHRIQAYPLLPAAALQESSSVRTAVALLDDLCEKNFDTRLTPQDIEYLTALLEAGIRRNRSVCRIALVCAHGADIDQILREEIETSISQAKVVCILSVRELDKLAQHQYDLLVSLAPLPYLPKGSEVLFLDREGLDLAPLRHKVRQLGQQKVPAPFYASPTSYPLFHPDAVLLGRPVQNKTALLNMLCGTLEQLKSVGPEYREGVFRREREGSTMLGKGIALPHGRSDGVHASRIAVAVLPEPLPWNETGAAGLVLLAAVSIQDPAAQAAVLRFYKLVAEMAAGKNPVLLERLQKAGSPEEAAGLLNAAIG